MDRYARTYRDRKKWATTVATDSSSPLLCSFGELGYCGKCTSIILWKTSRFTRTALLPPLIRVPSPFPGLTLYLPHQESEKQWPSIDRLHDGLLCHFGCTDWFPTSVSKGRHLKKNAYLMRQIPPLLWLMRSLLFTFLRTEKELPQHSTVAGSTEGGLRSRGGTTNTKSYFSFALLNILFYCVKSMYVIKQNVQ